MIACQLFFNDIRQYQERSLTQQSSYLPFVLYSRYTVVGWIHAGFGIDRSSHMLLLPLQSGSQFISVYKNYTTGQSIFNSAIAQKM